MSDSAKEEKTLSSFPLSSLPDELAVSCLARVPRSDHASLSLVCKRYRSLVISPEFYKIRSQLGRTEERLYVCVSTHPTSTPEWLILRRQKTVNRLRMNPFPWLPSQPSSFSSVVVLDWGIYVIGGFIKSKHTADVWLLDCRSNTWRQVPSMGVARVCSGAGVVGGKIYVFGGRSDHNVTNWGEVFDPKTQTWDTLTPPADRSEDDAFIHQSLVMEEKLYAAKWSEGIVCYSPREGKWGRRKKRDLLQYCYVGNLLYGVQKSYGNLVWRESDESEWKFVKGLEALHMIFDGQFLENSLDSKYICQVSSFGVNIIVLLWYEYNAEYLEIWCAEISLERREEKGEVWGRIERSEAVASRVRDPFGRDKVDILYSASVFV